jgi:hypothetical protein
MARRRLEKEEIQEVANKEWKKVKIFTSDEKLARRAAGLTGPKTPEGKAKSLQNLRVGRNKGEGTMSHGGYVKRILDEDEQTLYEERKEAYLKDYDINGSADEILLHMVLIDEVMLYRMLRRQFETPSLEIDRPFNECSTRLNKNLEALGALRKQRLKQDEKMTSISIATIAQQFARELMGGNIQAQLEEQAAEEEEFLRDKKQRERSLTVDADFYEIAEDVEEADSDGGQD